MEKIRHLPDPPHHDLTHAGALSEHPARGPLSEALPAFPYTIDTADQVGCPLHGDLRNLTDHVARHIVEPSARRALVVAHPWLCEIDVFASDAAAERFLSHRANDPSFDAVARAYTRIVQAAIVEADTLGWTVQPARRTSVHLDSAGLLVLIGGGIVRTAFIPGVERIETEFALRHESRNERIAREARERRWTAAERYYYRVFRPAMRSIRRYPTSGIRGDAQYGSLKRVLPRISDLGFSRWLAMRARLGHAPPGPESPKPDGAS